MAHQITIEQCIGEHKACIASAAGNGRIKHLYVGTIVSQYVDTPVFFEVNMNGNKTRYNYLQQAVDKYNSIP